MSRSPILVLTPSADLYGSPRALLSALPPMLDRAPVIILSGEDGPMLDLASELGASVEVVDDFAIRRRHLRPDRLPSFARRIARATDSIRHRLAGVQPELVYINTVAVPLAGRMRKMFGAPIVVHAHEVFDGPAALASLLMFPVRSADLVLANSETTARFVRSSTQNRTEVEVVFNGVPLPDERPVFGRGSTPLRVGCVGRIHPKKGHRVLFDAVSEAGRPWELHLFGDALAEHSDIAEELRARATSGELAGPVVFHGFVPDPDAVFPTVDVSVVPSVRPEEFSLVAAEGQLRGCATIVTGPGGAAEVVLDEVTGLVVPPGDSGALARALERLDDDRVLLETLARAGEERARSTFSEAEYQRRIAVVLEAVIRGS